MEIRPAKAADLRVGIGEQPPLQERVVAEIDPRHDMSGMEGRLFVFGKEVIRVAVEDHFPHPQHRHQRLGDQLGRVQQVEVEGKLILFGDQLQAELILGKSPASMASHRSRR